jgi:hypothetical protein
MGRTIRVTVLATVLLAALPAGAMAAGGTAAAAAIQAGPAVVADFNGDGIDDLAVGVPGENVGGITDAGAVEVFYGSGGIIGLPAVGDQLLRQGAAGMAGVAEAGDRFGAALATGLVDDGDEADLAVGAPGEDVGATGGAGAVSVVDGAAGGLLGSGNVLITESQPEGGTASGRRWRSAT